MNRISVASLGLSLFLLMPHAHAQSAAAPNPGLTNPGTARMNEAPAEGAMGNPAPAMSKLPKFSGNIAGGVAMNRVYADRTYDVSSPGMLIGPSPELGQEDPRFTGGVSGAQAGIGQIGGTSSNINEGFPSAAENNNGVVPGRSGIAQVRTGPDGTQTPENLDRKTLGAAPFVIGAGIFILAAFLFVRMRGMR